MRDLRSVLVRAPHVRLAQLRLTDDRIAAHLDGLAIAGADGIARCTAALEQPRAGAVFALAVRSIDEHRDDALARLLSLSKSLNDAKRGLLSGFGWVSATSLQGIVRELFASDDGQRVELAVAACRMHGVDPGPLLNKALRDDYAPLRAAAARAAGELGRSDLLGLTVDACDDPSPHVAYRAAVAACLLGDRGVGLQTLLALAREPGPYRDDATCWWMLASDFASARATIRRLARDMAPSAQAKRRVIRACGWSGDAHFVPWLIECMRDDAIARCAGEAFSLITDADLQALGLDRPAPPDAQPGPNDDPDDQNVALDEDDRLSWPDADRIREWWHASAPGIPSDSCAFQGAAPSPELCSRVLRQGYQRHRIVAARRLCLCRPGTPLFNVCAPAWRQQRQLSGE